MKDTQQQDTLLGDVPGAVVELDAVDAFVAQWSRERPDLDPSAKHVTGRIARINDLVQRRFAEAFEAVGLKDGAYGVLAALRRAGAPFQLTPTDLTRQLMVTSGGATGMVDRLERDGLVERSPHPTDRRGVLVGLTPAGVEVIDRAMALHSGVEQQIVAMFDDAERDALVALLRKLLLGLEPDPRLCL